MSPAFRSFSSLSLLQLSLVLTVFVFSPALRAENGKIRFRIVEDTATADATPTPARIHLVDSDKKPVLPDSLLTWDDHFNCDGTAVLDVPAGDYAYTVERGPEYRRASGTVTVTVGKTSECEVTLTRYIDMAARGWWSGETHIHRPLDDVPLLMRSEDLHVAPVMTMWNKDSLWKTRELPAPGQLVREAEKDRLYHVLAIEDERSGGALFFLNPRKPVDVSTEQREFPSPLVYMRRALEHGAWIDIEKPFWWDVPTWAASGEIDSIGIANNHMCRRRMYENEAWGRPRDESLLPPPRGNGFHSQEVYYRLLNCGLRIPPSAGSASGVLPNPIGYNRVYVHIDGEFGWDAWWKNLAAGRSFVTNGPMLLVEAGGKGPGSVFRGDERVEIALDVRVAGNDPIESVEVIRDGKVVQRREGGRLDAWLRPDPLVFERSGWFLVRTIAKVPYTFRFASTAPFFVEIGDSKSTIHRADVDYFLQWIDERIGRIERDEKGKLPDLKQRATIVETHREARRFYEGLLEKS